MFFESDVRVLLRKLFRRKEENFKGSEYDDRTRI